MSQNQNGISIQFSIHFSIPCSATGLATGNGIEGSSCLTILYSPVLPSVLFPGANPAAEPGTHFFDQIEEEGVVAR